MRRRRRSAFSLLEVLLGSILFASIVIFLANIWGLHARTVGNNRSRMVATFIAGQQLEDCIVAGYRGVQVKALQEPGEQIVRIRTRNQTREIRYRYQVEAEEHPDPKLKGRLIVAIVKVSYPDESKLGGKSEVVYRTLVGQN